MRLFEKIFDDSFVSNELRRLIYKLVIITGLSTYTIYFTNTFFILYVIKYVGFYYSSQLLILSFLVQLVTDFPTATLADKIGHKWVLFTAVITYGAGLVLGVFITTLESFIIMNILLGFGTGQESGTVQSWYDNSYKELSKKEKNETLTTSLYRMVQGRSNTITNIAVMLAFSSGGIVAFYISRKVAIVIEALLLFLIGIISLIWMNKVKITNIEAKSTSYSILIKKTLQTVSSSKRNFIFFCAYTFRYSALTIWGMFIGLQVYYAYGTNDFIVGVFRTGIYFLTIPLSIIVTNISKKLAIKGWIWKSSLVMTLFYSIVLGELLLSPPKNDFQAISLFIIFIALIISNNFHLLLEIFSANIFYEIVPSENRNSVYSFVPTIGTIVTAFFLLITGQLALLFSTDEVVITMLLLVIVSCCSSLFFFTFAITKPKNNETKMTENINESPIISD